MAAHKTEDDVDTSDPLPSDRPALLDWAAIVVVCLVSLMPPDSISCNKKGDRMAPSHSTTNPLCLFAREEIISVSLPCLYLQSEQTMHHDGA